MLLFEWDPAKAQTNKRKHGVSFEEAATCFRDEHGRYYGEIEHGDRFVLIAMSEKERLIYCVHAELHEGTIRIISARAATRVERRQYEEGE